VRAAADDSVDPSTEPGLSPPGAKKSDVRRGLIKFYPVTVVLWAAVVILFAQPRTPWIWPGAVLVAAGEALRLWAAGYDNRRTRGTPAREKKGFPTAGPYGWVRNPNHIGNVAAVAGLTLWAGGLLPWLPLAAVALFVWQYSLAQRARDQDLGRRFDWEYRAYRGTVPVWLPRLAPRPLGRGGRWHVGVALTREVPAFAIIAGVVVAAVLRSRMIG
jgi:protein-S-isoprenylcysteine O-methyltransferase Ste14